VKRTLREPVRGVRRLIVVVALAFSLGALVDSLLTTRLRYETTSLSTLSATVANAVHGAAEPAHPTTDVPVQPPGEQEAATVRRPGRTFGGASAWILQAACLDVHCRQYARRAPRLSIVETCDI